MREKRIKNGFTYTFLAIGGVAMLFPVIWMFFACFKTNNEIFGSLRLLPESWVIEAFVKGWKTTGTYTYAQYFINTFALVVPTTFLTWYPVLLWLMVLHVSIFQETRRCLWC